MIAFPSCNFSWTQPFGINPAIDGATIPGKSSGLGKPLSTQLHFRSQR
jgi:hypothetical protein